MEMMLGTRDRSIRARSRSDKRPSCRTVVAFMAVTLCSSVSFADDVPAGASPAASPTASGDAVDPKEASPCRAPSGTTNPDDHLHNDPKFCDVKKIGIPSDKAGSSGNSALASKLANPSAPVMALKSYIDVSQNGGSAPGAHRASLNYTFQPALPFPTKRGNVIFRPGISVLFGEPYATGAGNVDTAVAFNNITLDTLYGKTFKNGLLVMGGFSTLFPSNSRKELRADWTIGPEAVLGYASPKTGNVWGALANFTWKFPTRGEGQSVGGQYFYAINVGKGYQISASPFWSYDRESKVLRFPMGIGVKHVGVFGKNNLPIQMGAEIWAYTPPPGSSGPEWTVRMTIAPVVPLPWKK